MIALHARRSATAIATFADAHPGLPLIVALTGTDLYRDIRMSRRAQRSLALASRLVVLQPRGIDELPIEYRSKARVVFQSAEPTRRLRQDSTGDGDRRTLRVCVLGHLRHEKDPRRAALATRLLGEESRVKVVHAGAALSDALDQWARAESNRNPCYQWLGEVPRARARRILADSDLMVLSSRIEGGANVLSEALADSVPILASNIPSTCGILGTGYPGLFPVGDTKALAGLLHRAKADPAFLGELKAWCARLAPLVDPARERSTWRKIIREVTVSVHGRARG
jgi:putative glycosyltransferase (TIGR04348 family)